VTLGVPTGIGRQYRAKSAIAIEAINTPIMMSADEDLPKNIFLQINQVVWRI
jgi:hypothetical protein